MPLATMLQPFPAHRGGGGGGRGGEALGGLLAGPGVELAPPAREQVAIASILGTENQKTKILFVQTSIHREIT